MVAVTVRPSALLLDFGGVLVDAPAQPPAPVALVERLQSLTCAAIPPEQIVGDMVTGTREYAAWRDLVSTDGQPVELSHAQVWDDFITRDWPAAARNAVRREATSLSYAWTRCPEWAIVPGMDDLLAIATEAGIPMAIVSNTLCGAAHRDFLADVGLADRFAVQLYSDELGVRKPHPGMALRAAAELGVPIERCWFVGDTLSRDIACARRAGVGTAVLLRSARTDREQAPEGIDADVRVEDGYALCALLARCLGDCGGSA